MARQRDPRRDIAKNIWLESKGKRPLKDIAAEIGVSDSQIRKWKSLDKWADDLKGNVTNARGAPKGNSNAKGASGNKHASPPKGNKNAVKTGEHETIFADTLTDKEKEIYSTLDDDPLFVLAEEIRILKIRQHRMMNRIKDHQDSLSEKEVSKLYEMREQKRMVTPKGSTEKVAIKVNEMVLTEKREKNYRKLSDILAIEEALTRVSAQLTRTIKQYNETAVNTEKIELLKAQTAELRGSNKGNDDANNWTELLREAEKEIGGLIEE